MTKNTINRLEEIEKIEKAVTQLQNIQQQSIAKREILLDQLNSTNEELKKYDINPKEVDKAIEEKANKIDELLKEIENMIPWDLVDSDDTTTRNVAKNFTNELPF